MCVYTNLVSRAVCKILILNAMCKHCAIDCMELIGSCHGLESETGLACKCAAIIYRRASLL